jgi:hypothetical protein
LPLGITKSPFLAVPNKTGLKFGGDYSIVELSA